MTRRDESKHETRQLILDAARELFWESGVDGCTMRRIGRRAGVSPASVVVHFKNKTALLEAVLGERIEATLDQALASMPATAELRDRLMHVVAAFFRLYGSNKALYTALIRETCFAPDEQSPHLARLNRRYLSIVAGELEAEQARGRIRRSVDLELAAGALFSLYFGILVAFFRTPELGVDTAIAMLSTIAGEYLEGISVPEACR